ncbi:MAG TPA: hypothetical protein VMV77_12720 [Bacteroidales bacterium]|nr:hypothetical protein [Bacteroidales bacterium]
MERTRPPKLNLPDAINCSISKNFTQVPTKLLRDPNVTSKAKAYLCLLLSNKDGWSSHVTMIQTMVKEKMDAIQSGLQELEGLGYLMRIKYRDKKTKIWKGSFWAYTDHPGKFNVEEQLKILDKIGCEPQPGFPRLDYPDLGYPRLDNPAYNNINTNNTNNKKINNTLSPTQEKNKIYLPLAKYLYKIISSSKNVKYNLGQIKPWANEIRKLSETNKVSYERIEKALQWYEKNIGGQYIPVILSGTSLREKFVKLEDAMKRGKYDTNNGKPDSMIEYGERWELQENGQYRNDDGVLMPES